MVTDGCVGGRVVMGLVIHMVILFFNHVASFGDLFIILKGGDDDIINIEFGRSGGQ